VTNPVNKLKEALPTLKERWKTPAEGEYTTLKEFVSYCVGTMGICGFTFLCGETVSFASGYFAGAIMEIKLIDFTIITFITLIVRYLTLYVESNTMTIFENLGHVDAKKKRQAIIAYALCLVVGIACYFVPTAPFDGLIKGLPYIVGNLLTVMGAGGFVNWIVRKKLCKKYGRYKPFLVIYGIPAALITVAMTFIPSTLDYALKIAVLHFAATLRARFTVCYCDNVTQVVALISPNMVERQRYYSIGAIPLGFFRSIFRIIFPMLIVYTGGYFDIRSYRVFVPIFALVSLLTGFAIIGVKEKNPDAELETHKIEFKKSAKHLLKNKYFWIMYSSNTLALWISLADTVLNMILIYQMRTAWVTGLLSIFGITSVVGNLLTPALIKKFEKRTCILTMRSAWLVITAFYLIALKFQSIPVFLVIMFIRSAISAACNNITGNMYADILDYHQWKTGERADSMRAVFDWIFTPIGTALGLISPALLAKFGYTSDWDVLFDPNVFYKIMYAYIILTIISMVASTLPYLFYDLKRKDLDRYVAETRARAAEFEEQEAAAQA